MQRLEGTAHMSAKIPVAISFTGVANFLGVIGIIGSLIFVALELRQSQRIAIAAQQQARTILRQIKYYLLMNLVKMKSVWKISHGVSNQTCNAISESSVKCITGQSTRIITTSIK